MATGTLASKLQSAGLQDHGGQQRSVYRIIDPSISNMGKMALKNIVQGNYQNYVSPFFLIDEFGPMQLPKGTPFRVDAHPHAGIIPTTYLMRGNAHHRDSMDNDFDYEAGDFIHFTAGRGALHMEETGDELYHNGGVFHGFQAWLNIPSKLKKSMPDAGLLKKGDIKTIENETTRIRVILGEVLGVKSATNLLMPVIYWHISMKANANVNLPVDPIQNVFVYVQNGQLEINGAQLASTGQTVLFERDGDYIKLEAKKATELLVLGGEVNNEPYVAQGPFVLDSEQEIIQAYTDYQQGKFGDPARTNGKRR